MATKPCPRTGLPTSLCECYSMVPDLNEELTAEQIEACKRLAADRERMREQESAL